VKIGWTGIIRLVLVLSVLAGIALRPTGTMLAVEGDTVAYVICTAGEVKNITVSLDQSDGGHEEIDAACDFFASQIAAFPFSTPNVESADLIAIEAVAVQPDPLDAQALALHPYTPRAPPLVI